MKPTKTGRRRSSAAPRGRLFSVAEADRMLPLVRRIVQDVVDQHGRVTELELQAQVAVAGGVHADIRTAKERYARGLERLRELAAELEDLGIELKDAQRGLIDFPALHDGRRVYLCWLLGEEHVGHWHDLEAGFAGRQPIDANFDAPGPQSVQTA